MDAVFAPQTTIELLCAEMRETLMNNVKDWDDALAHVRIKRPTLEGFARAYPRQMNPTLETLIELERACTWIANLSDATFDNVVQ